MGQPYDGRATDAWSLGVLLYALLESRLPFDPHPGVGDYAMQMRMRSRTSHRIARVEWRWIEYGVKDGEDGEGDHEADLAKFESKGLTGAMEVVEGLLKRARTRWPLSKVAETEWVAGGIRVFSLARVRGVVPLRGCLLGWMRRLVVILGVSQLILKLRELRRLARRGVVKGRVGGWCRCLGLIGRSSMLISLPRLRVL